MSNLDTVKRLWPNLEWQYFYDCDESEPEYYFDKLNDHASIESKNLNGYYIDFTRHHDNWRCTLQYRGEGELLVINLAYGFDFVSTAKAAREALRNHVRVCSQFAEGNINS